MNTYIKIGLIFLALFVLRILWTMKMPRLSWSKKKEKFTPNGLKVLDWLKGELSQSEPSRTATPGTPGISAYSLGFS